MAIASLSVRLIDQTATMIEKRLGAWIDWLHSTPYLAFGDDPGPVFELENELNDLIGQTDRLRFQFDHARDSFDTVYAYRTARESLYQAAELVSLIRNQDRGSTEFTRNVSHSLGECRHFLQMLTVKVNTSNNLHPMIDA